MLPKVAKRAATFPDRLTFHVLFSVTRMKIHNGKSFGILFYAHKIECMKIIPNVYAVTNFRFVSDALLRIYHLISASIHPSVPTPETAVRLQSYTLLCAIFSELLLDQERMHLHLGISWKFFISPPQSINLQKKVKSSFR